MAESLKQVGEFPAPIPAPVMAGTNPYDKATLVSIFPQVVEEVKHTVYPGRFTIEPGTFEKPSILVIGSSSWFKVLGNGEPPLEVPVFASQMAESIIHDYCSGMLECDMGTAQPGLIFIPGEVTVTEVLSKYKVALTGAKLKQDAWFSRLTRLADSLWARSNQNPLVIWDEMRLAARSLGYDAPWIKDYQMVKMVKCFGCGGLKDPEYPICQHCKTIDPNHPKAADIKTAT
jgi:hypothetical protein